MKATATTDGPSKEAPKTRLASVRSVVVVCMLLHALLLAWGAFRHSPVWDEIGHLPAGLSHWQVGRYDLYRVNPPLVRSIAAMPVLLAGVETDWSSFSETPGARPEFAIGRDFLTANGQRSFWLFTLARWACIPFSLLGAYVCYRWADELYGTSAGIVALVLWCFSPNIIAHAQLITPDAAAAALGIAAAYVFWRWLHFPTTVGAVVSGLVLGLAGLTKMTWIVLPALWPLLWIVWTCARRHGSSWSTRLREGVQVAVILLIALSTINIGYGFEGSFSRLGSYTFVSRTLGGARHSGQSNAQIRNRFAGSWRGQIPVPVPKNYLLGIDAQKLDFERGYSSYLRGEWAPHGWWYFYLYGLAIKVPLGTWGLIALALAIRLRVPSQRRRHLDEITLLAPAMAVLVLVSSQTGHTHHLRYVLPMFPFVFVWTSRAAQAIEWRQWKIVWIGAALLGWSVFSSLRVYPHSLSYFNELVGGPTGGHAHLADSNIDWGQDLLYLKRWLQAHPEASPLGLSFRGSYHPGITGIDFAPIPEEPRSGWYAVSVTSLHYPTLRYAYFLRYTPVAMAGYSIYIYHVTPEEANRVRRELGLPEAPAD